MLGEFEYLLITAAAGLGEKAYGAAIREEIEATTQRKCSMGALYTTMDRLETKGLLKRGWAARRRSVVVAPSAWFA
jgi:PadR family transcriptional regulator PadR